MHHFLYPKMQTCSKTEKYIQRNASTDNLPELAFLILGTYFTAPLGCIIYLILALRQFSLLFCFQISSNLVIGKRKSVFYLLSYHIP